MNRTPIEWANFTWNPITGCQHGCKYCYARRFAQRGLGRYNLIGFRPTFHIDRLKEPASVKRPSRVFTGSMGDLLGEWPWLYVSEDGDFLPDPPHATPIKVCWNIAEGMRQAPWHTYIVLTKANLNAIMIADRARILADAGAWIGVSVTGKGTGTFDMGINEYMRITGFLDKLPGNRKIVSLEPLIGDYFLIDKWPDHWAKHGVRWVIIGGMTGPMKSKYPRPDQDKVEAFVERLRALGVAVFVKDNLGFLTDIREYPGGMPKGDRNSDQEAGRVLPGAEISRVPREPDKFTAEGKNNS